MDRKISVLLCPRHDRPMERPVYNSGLWFCVMCEKEGWADQSVVDDYKAPRTYERVELRAVPSVYEGWLVADYEQDYTIFVPEAHNGFIVVHEAGHGFRGKDRFPPDLFPLGFDRSRELTTPSRPAKAVDGPACVNRVWDAGDMIDCGRPVALIAERPSKYCDECIVHRTAEAWSHVLAAKGKMQAALDAYQRELEDCFPPRILG